MVGLLPSYAEITEGASGLEPHSKFFGTVWDLAPKICRCMSSSCAPQTVYDEKTLVSEDVHLGGRTKKVRSCDQ
jgi:hypothetical protein